MPSDDQAPPGPRDPNGIFDLNGRILPEGMVNGPLIAAARALLGWDQSALAERAGIRRHTLADLERGGRRPQARVRDAVLGTLEEAGIRFVEIDGDSGLVLDRGQVRGASTVTTPPDT